ncbi:MAG: ribonuclease HII [Candidatus Thermoplasmatota archaeon]|nr:ribonuclease HII [Candidatus Thermoplasmatota archaeon]
MICGVDEAGRGPVMGPLVICGICVQSDKKLKELKVRDSKQLTPDRREELEKAIRAIADIEIIELSASEIDSMRSRLTMNQIEAKVFSMIVNRLSPDEAYLDAADASEEGFERMVCSELKCRPRVVSKHKADQLFPVVSAASIVAKVRRDLRMSEIAEQMGQDIGSGYSHDKVTLAFIEDYLDRNGELPPHTRKSWDTSKNIIMRKRLRPLDSFG